MKSEREGFIQYHAESLTEEEMLERANSFYAWANTRRSVRDFSNKPVSREIMEKLVMTGSTAPSGANKQPWTFCLISNSELKSKLRQLAEKEEKISYKKRMSQEWLNDLKPLGTDWQKEFIDVAPWIVVVMRRIYENDQGEKKNNYYVTESVGIAVGFFLMAVHNVGLIALTHTPSPMNFLTKALNRPENERPFLLIPIGHPVENALVPDITRKIVDKVIHYYE